MASKHTTLLVHEHLSWFTDVSRSVSSQRPPQHFVILAFIPTSQYHSRTTDWDHRSLNSYFCQKTKNQTKTTANVNVLGSQCSASYSSYSSWAVLWQITFTSSTASHLQIDNIVTS